MIVMISGAAALLAGASVFTFARHRTSDPTIENFLRETRPLSQYGRAALDKICSGPDPNSGPDVRLSISDYLAIFRNSRLYVCIANRVRLREPEDTELADLFYMMQTDHAKLRWLLFISGIESIVGRLGLGRITHYARMLLWTYGEEHEILSQISEKCGPTERTAMLAIL